MKGQPPEIPAIGAKRRSTRIPQAVRIVITRQLTGAKPIIEEAATISINCHGFRYFSRYRPKKNAPLSIQVHAAQEDSCGLAEPYPARVAWIRKSKRLDGFYQIGVEFDTPHNLWNVDQPPEDWESFSAAIPENPVALLAEVERLLHIVHAGTHYQLLDVTPRAERSEVKRRFYRLARRFHPDQHMDHPEWTPRLLDLMGALTTAYKTLSSGEPKRQYDALLAQAPDQTLSEPKQLAGEWLENARKCLAEKNYVGSILWLRRVIENEPQSAGYRTMLGQSLAHVPEYRREAVEQFEKAIELDSDNLAAHLCYAQLLEQMRYPWRARLHYVRVLEIDRSHRVARERLHHLDTATPRTMSRASLLDRLTGRR